MAKKVLVAMSGGVDSSVTAWLLQQQGYECIGGMMQLHGGTVADAEDARQVAKRLGIPFYLFDFRQEFEHTVMQKFADCYSRGETPNPCYDCNRYLKFGKLLAKARGLGAERIATGHYVRSGYDAAQDRWYLSKAADLSRDQSYVLACLDQDQIANTLFPLGGLTKAEVRHIAEKQGFVNARKHDSQDICFIPDGDYGAFLERFTGVPSRPGDILDTEGRVLGRHRGAICYTLGQRKGLGVSAATPLYVCGKSMERNTVTLGPEELLFQRELIAGDFNWAAVSGAGSGIRCKAKVRYRQQEQWATVEALPDGRVRVTFDAPQRAITSGQAVVLYDGDRVLGGGTIL